MKLNADDHDHEHAYAAKEQQQQQQLPQHQQQQQQQQQHQEQLRQQLQHQSGQPSHEHRFYYPVGSSTPASAVLPPHPQLSQQLPLQLPPLLSRGYGDYNHAAHPDYQGDHQPVHAGQADSPPPPYEEAHPDFMVNPPDTVTLVTSANSAQNQTLPRQRTSIACRYCRKRKIRCSGFSTGGSCQNCSRMHEECVFQPVSSANSTAFVAIAAVPGGIPPGTPLYGHYGQPIGQSPGMQGPLFYSTRPPHMPVPVYYHQVGPHPYTQSGPQSYPPPYSQSGPPLYSQSGPAPYPQSGPIQYPHSGPAPYPHSGPVQFSQSGHHSFPQSAPLAYMHPHHGPHSYSPHPGTYAHPQKHAHTYALPQPHSQFLRAPPQPHLLPPTPSPPVPQSSLQSPPESQSPYGEIKPSDKLLITLSKRRRSESTDEGDLSQLPPTRRRSTEEEHKRPTPRSAISSPGFYNHHDLSSQEDSWGSHHSSPTEPHQPRAGLPPSPRPVTSMTVAAVITAEAAASAAVPDTSPVPEVTLPAYHMSVSAVMNLNNLMERRPSVVTEIDRTMLGRLNGCRRH